MISKEHIENFLRVNDISTTAPDDEIKRALIMARWHKDDAEVAISILRERQVTESSITTSEAHILHTKRTISAQTLSSLLGTQVDTSEVFNPEDDEDEETPAKIQTLSIIVLTVVIACMVALIGATVFMYFSETGLFYSPY